MMLKRKTFGPRVSLTERQEAAIISRVESAGLQCCVEQCHTGSVYVTISESVEEIDINGRAYMGSGDEIAKIRLSGHDEGRRTDSTHCCVGSKPECMASLAMWLDDIISKETA